MKSRFEIIDSNDIIVAVADLKEDAIYAAGKYGAYVFDTLTKKVLRRTK